MALNFEFSEEIPFGLSGQTLSDFHDMQKFFSSVEIRRKPNNWRRMHGFKTRRKGRGRKKPLPVFYVDEAWTMVGPDCLQALAALYSRSRHRPSSATQQFSLP